MLTLNDAKEYLSALGIELPDSVLQLLVDSVNTIDDCLTTNYSTATAQLIRLYLVALLATANGARMISSQTAPSGAARSFTYRSLSDAWRGLSGLLRTLDTKGCTDGMVPPNPSQQAHGGIWIGKGGGFCCE
ncbi:MAG: hypothetical protein ACK5LJ_16040 [Paracoccus sp. (in: a-proteobacteria)]